MYRVIKAFADVYDAEHVYNVGDEFPRAGVSVSEARLEELSSDENRCGVALIVNEDPTEDAPMPTGAAEDAKTGVDPSESAKTKKKPRKR